ncbi:MAG: acetyltransferase [bacterium]|nr:acetyltransferase [bacterium]
MNNKPIVLIGSGGHAKVILDILKKSGYTAIKIIDDDVSKTGQKLLGIEIVGTRKWLKGKSKEYLVIIGIGNNKIRNEISGKLKKEGFKFGVAIHPAAVIGEDVKIGEGTVVMANAVINSGTKIGKHCIVNTSVSIDHDNLIGDYVHLSPGATTGGTVVIGQGTWIGLGAGIINNITIGKEAIIAAGSIVINDIGDRKLAAGVPAKIKKEL